MNIKQHISGHRCFACLSQEAFSAQRHSENATERIPSSETNSHDQWIEGHIDTRFAPCHYMVNEYSHNCGQIIDNSSILLRKLANIYVSGNLSDITLVVGDRSFNAHKLVLCLSSDVFQIMLMNDAWSDHNKTSICLQEESECEVVFELFLAYFYTSGIHLTHETVLPVLMLADKYNVFDLQALCQNYMQSHLVGTISNNQTIYWYQYALLCHHRTLALDCEQFIMWNFAKIGATKYFIDIDISVLEYFLQSSDLVIANEYAVFCLLRTWLYASQEEIEPTSAEDITSKITSAEDNTDEGKEVNLRVPSEDVFRLLSHIRFPMMSPEELILLQNDSLTIRFSKFFIEQIELALKLHYNDIENITDILPSNRLYLTKARCYTDSTWCSELAIENFSTLVACESRLLVFSTPVSGTQKDQNKAWDWHLDLYPKGMEFGRCWMLSFLRKLEVPGANYDVVRAVLKNTQASTHKHVQVCILVTGIQDGEEYIRRLVKRTCHFDSIDCAYNIDNVVPYNTINELPQNKHSPFLVGEKSDTFKLRIIIKPC